MSSPVISWFLAGLLGTSTGCLESRCLTDYEMDCSSVTVEPTDIEKDGAQTLVLTVDGTLLNAAIQAGDGVQVSLLQANSPVKLLGDGKMIPMGQFVPGEGYRYKFAVNAEQLAPLRSGPVALEVVAGLRFRRSDQALQINKSLVPTGPWKIPLSAVSVGFAGSAPSLVTLQQSNQIYNIAKYSLTFSDIVNQYALPTVQRSDLKYFGCSATNNINSIISYCYTSISGNREYHMDIHSLAGDLDAGTPMWISSRSEIQV